MPDGYPAESRPALVEEPDRPSGETEMAGSAGVTPACVGLEPTLILPIDPPRTTILLRLRRGASPALSRREATAVLARLPAPVHIPDERYTRGR
jgi:hypothetical protein